jgi:Lar family restriction alleviation protein
MSDLELKPCPFCGPGQSIVTCYQDDYGYWTVGCGRCGSHSGKRPRRDPEGRRKVIDLWNSRPNEMN